MQSTFINLLTSFRDKSKIFMVIIALFIGILGALARVAFNYLIKVNQYLFFQTHNYSLDVVKSLPFWQKILAPFLGALIVGFIIFYICKEVKGSGIPEVMESVALHGGAIKKRVSITKLIASSITLGSGCSAGKEGPVVQIGAAFASACGQFMKVSGIKLRTITACGAAAGISASFNAPIAGAMFSVEVILGELNFKQFSPIVISSVTATVISRHFFGDTPVFQIPEYDIISSYEYFHYLVLGIIAGLTAVFFIKTMSLSQDLSNKIQIPEFFKPALGGLLVGIIGLTLPQIYGIGYETTINALWGRNVGAFLILIIIMKVIATAATIGFGASGGIFAPSLVIGSCLGALMGGFFESIHLINTASANAYALVGMGAVLSGVTHAPISSILIIFELTNNYKVLAPLMVSCIISILISSWLNKESIYTLKLVKKGIDIYRDKDVNLLKRINVQDIYKKKCAKVYKDDSFETVINTIKTHPTSEVFVVDNNDNFKGIVSLIQFRSVVLNGKCLTDKTAMDCLKKDIIPLFLDDTLDLAVHHFGKINEDELPVLESESNPKLIGSVQLRDVIEAYNNQINRWETTGGTHTFLTAAFKKRHLNLTRDIIISKLDLPDGFLGKKIKDIQVSSTYNVQIILIDKSSFNEMVDKNEPESLMLPYPEYEFSPEDKIIVIGKDEDVKKLEEK